jgi:virginiamycin B lyase
VLAALLTMASAGGAAAAPQPITEFSAASGLAVGSSPRQIVAGADGNTWFIDHGTTPALGRITPAGVITEFGFADGLDAGATLASLTLGSNGNVWFADFNVSSPSIGQITPAGTITEYPLGSGSEALSIAEGADGNVWFTDSDPSAPSIGRITPTGAITRFSNGLIGGSRPGYIVAGVDGNLWFTDDNSGAPAIGRVTPNGTITEFTSGLAAGNAPNTLAATPDGDVWFTTNPAGSQPSIGRVTSAGVITDFTHTNSSLPTGSKPWAVAAGPDGNAWFSDAGSTPAIGRITPAGTITEFSAGLNSGSLPIEPAAGADGNVWFTDIGATPAIGRVTPAGAITEFSAANGLNAGSSPNELVAGPDGNLWFTDLGTTRAVGRLALQLGPAVVTGVASAVSATGASVAGTVNPLGGAVSAVSIQYGPTTAYRSRITALPAMLPAGGRPVAISAALTGLPARTVIHYRVVATNAYGTVTGADRTFTTLSGPAPSLTGLRESSRRWREGRGGGTTFNFSLNEPATVRLAFAAIAPGRRAGKRCVAPNRHNKHQRSCTRASSSGALTVTARFGRNRISFGGRLKGRSELKPGSYVVTVTATDSAGRSKPQTLRFAIAPRRAGAASATTYCVTTPSPPPSCTGTPESSLFLALLAADGDTTGTDTIVLPAGTQTGLPSGYRYTGSVPLEIDGQGPSSTLLTLAAAESNDSTPVLGDNDAEPSITLRLLGVTVPSGSTGYGIDLRAPATISQVAINSTAPSSIAIGMLLSGGGTVSDASVAIPSSPTANDVGLQVESGSASTSTTVLDSTVSGGAEGVYDSGIGKLIVHRSSLSATGGGNALETDNAPAVIDDSLLSVAGPGSALEAYGSESATAITGTQLTIVGDHASTGVAALADNGTASVDLTDSIIADSVGTSLETVPLSPNTTTITTDYTDYDHATITGAGSVLVGAHDPLSFLSPEFADPSSGDYRLLSTSPLLGLDPTPLGATPVGASESAADRDGLARITGAGRDLGAFQHQIPTVHATASLASVLVGAPVSFAAGGRVAGPDDPLTYSWHFDDGAASPEASVSHPFAMVGRHSGTVTATDALGFSATATASVSVRPSNAFAVVSKHVSASGVITLRVKTHAAGRLTAGAAFSEHGRHYGSARGTPSRSDLAKLTIKPTRAAMKLLAASHGLHVRIALKFTPTGGTANRIAVALTVKPRRGRRTT